MTNLSKTLLGLFVASSAASPFLGPVPSIMSGVVFALVYFENRAYDHAKVRRDAEAFRRGCKFELEKVQASRDVAIEALKMEQANKVDLRKPIEDLRSELEAVQTKLTAVGIKLNMNLGKR